MIVRCTAKLLNLLGKHSLTLVEAPPSEDDWYANLLWLDRRKCLLVTHAGTLFPVFAADVRKGDLQPLGPYLVGLIEVALRQENLSADALGPLDPGSLRLARTASRSVLGLMTEMTFYCRYHVEAEGGLDETDVDALNYTLRRRLHNRDGHYHDPLELVSQRIQAR